MATHSGASARSIAPYVDVTLTGEVRLADALTHLYVLLPVLDNAKHYWVSSDEVRAGSPSIRSAT